MIYPRLKLAKDLLSDDGVIFISIDDNEIHNLRKMCDEVFGEVNFVALFTWIKKKKGSHLSKTVRSMTEYVLCYSTKLDNVELYGENAYTDKQQPLAKRTNSLKVLCFPANSIYTTLKDNFYKKGFYGEGTSGLSFLNDFNVSKGVVVDPIKVEGPFVWVQSKLDIEISSGSEINLSSKFGFNILRSDQEEKIKRPSTLIDAKNDVGTNEDAYEEIKKLFRQEAIMSYPKPVSIIRYLLNTLTFFHKDSTILDFFSGSATTAHAVMQLNAEDGGNRKFIMVQIPEETDEKSGAYKAGYKNICEIGKERIRRAGKKIVEELREKSSGQQSILDDNSNPYINNPDSLDIGFRVLKVDSSNMKDVYYHPEEFKQEQLSVFEDNIREDRSSEDLLYQVMLDMGVLLSSKIETRKSQGYTYYVVNDNDLICCFDKDLNDDIVTEIAKLKPLYAVFRDSSFQSDSVAVNFEQIFETYSPKTTRKVL